METTKTNSANFFIKVPVSGAPGVPARLSRLV
jgi:hypothetical protein